MPQLQNPSQSIEVALEAEPTPPAPPPPEPSPPKVTRPVIHREVKQPAALPLMAAVSSSPTQFSAAPESQQSPVVETPPPVSGPVEPLEAQYAATLRANIDSRNVPPSSAEYRLLKPHGEVRVSFILDRSGMMIASQLAHSSGSSLLDHHALEIVRNGRYPPFPELAFQGESRHSFFITLEFHS